MTPVKRVRESRSRKKLETPKKAGWGERIERALLYYQSQIAQARVSLADFGAAVANQQGRAAPFSKGAVGQWISEKNEPTFATLEAIAHLAACDPWWIVWEQGAALGGKQPLELSRGAVANAEMGSRGAALNSHLSKQSQVSQSRAAGRDTKKTGGAGN